ncbi:MAG TPA: DnaB-like helicase N-terminal domain-containing protein, partial [Mycobacteriales bacterium]|nr:DnaB-like helicase N-terminal domain-containing protein [Mycobacteriales bacterium]
MSVLGGVLLSKDAIADVVEVLNPHDFYRPAHTLVFEAALDLYSRGEPVDPVSVAAELTRSGSLAKVGGASYLHTLVASVPTAANAGYYARLVAEKAILRRLVEAGTRVVQMGYAGGVDGDVDSAVDRAQAEIYAVSERRSGEDYVALSELLNPTLEEIEAIAGREGGMAGVPTGIADLDRLTNGLHPGQLVIVAARPGLGKALALDTPLPTPMGWTTMGEVRVGDQLIDADGKPTTVVAATDVMVDRPCYEIEFSDGTVIVADAEHQWRTTTRSSRRSAHQAGALRATGAAVRTTAEIAATARCSTKDQRANHAVENASPLQLDEADLVIPPYTLGVWLGDGHSASARFTSADPEIAMYVESDGFVVTPRGKLLFSIGLPERAPVPTRDCVVCGATFVPHTTQVRTCGRRCGGAARGTDALPAPTCVRCGQPAVTGFGHCSECHATHGTVGARLRWIGVLGDKHIPTAYLRASESQRRELLAGLLDTDGTVMPSGSVQFAVTNRRLARDFVELLTGLGYGCGVHEKHVRGRSEQSSTCYIVTFTTTDEVFRLERKKLAHKERNASNGARTGLRFITGVRPVASVPVRCVQVDNPDHMYLASRAMIPTHNSTLALDFARAASIKHGLASVVFSLEMSKSEIT